MKKVILTLLSLPVLFMFASCEKTVTSISGEQSPLGEVGTRLGDSNFAGADDINVSVVSLENGVSTIGGTFTMTDPRYKKLIENFPQFFDVDGDHVTVHDIKFKVTDKGIQNKTGVFDGVIIKYDSKVGDSYGNGRKVKSVSKDNDFVWRGGMKIKAIEVEHNIKNVDGVKKVTYWGNHRFGIVAVETEFEDGSTDFSYISLY